MIRRSITELLVGLFMLAGIIAFVMLAFRVSGLAQYRSNHNYQVSAEFDNIGGLKVRAPVSIGGVRIGEIDKIVLDSKNFRAKVYLQIDNKFKNTIPTDSSASILTQGLLGSNYISITPGFDDSYLQNDGSIQNTHSAIILENLIGQLIYSVKGEGKTTKG